jgi:chaperonin GroEL
MRKVFTGDEARDILLKGAEMLAQVVGSSMGPLGRNCVFDPARDFPAYPSSSRDGVTIARQYMIEGPYASGVKMVKEAAERTLREAGDGTSATVVLAHAILKNGLLSLKTENLVKVRRQIASDVEKVCAYIDSIAVPVEGPMLEQVAVISANNDEHLGRLVAEATIQAGKFGVVTVEEAMGSLSTIERIEGMSLDQGFISPIFVNNERRQICELDNPVILLLDRPLTSMQGLAPLMNAIASKAQPLLILAEDVRGEALATLATNKMQGRLSVCAVKLPSNLGHRKDLLLDLAALTGGTACLQELGMDVSKLNIGHLGRALKVTVTASQTRISGGNGSADSVGKRVETIQGLLAQTPTDLEKEKLQERLAKLTGGLTVIRLAARSGLEMGDLKARCEDSCLATRSALEGGVVIGAGLALYTMPLGILADGVIQESLAFPAKQIASNAGCAVGLDALSGAPVEGLTSGILDPAIVVKAALRNAASVASVMLASDCVIQISE